MPEPVIEPNKNSHVKPAAKTPPEAEKELASNPIADLQQQVGNRAVQRLIQRSGGEGAFRLDDDTAGRIDRARGGGQPLEPGTREQMSAAMGHDFSDVNVHTSRESDDLNQQVGAEAFTTGNDIFFKEGAYNPASGDGQELIAHELAHVVQQGTGKTGGDGGGMSVNAPGDAHEQEADAVAQSVTGPGGKEAVQMHAGEPEVQLQELPEEELEEEEEVQRQELPEEELEALDEDEIQMQEIPEEELTE